MLETIIAVGVIGNFTLQLGWFIWSYRVHHRKHFTDAPMDIISASSEIDILDNLKEYVDKEILKLEGKINWRDFGAKTEPLPQGPSKLENGKYNPDEIVGTLDSMFNAEND